MPDIELVGLILLLAVAVIFGYFYLKRAQGRTTTQVVTRDAATTSSETSRPVTADSARTSDEIGGEERPPS